MDQQEFKREYLARPSFDPFEVACYECAEIYDRETDKFDATVCSHARNRWGEPIPFTPDERRQCRLFADDCMRRLITLVKKRFNRPDNEIGIQIRKCLVLVRKKSNFRPPNVNPTNQAEPNNSEPQFMPARAV